MSYASSRAPAIGEYIGINSSGNIGESFQLGNTVPVVLTSGVQTNLLTINYPKGIYIGFAIITYIGDATTAIEYMKIIEDNEELSENYEHTYNISTTLPSTDLFYIKYPLTTYPSLGLPLNDNETILVVDASFTGTPITITSIYVRLLKVV